MPGAPNRPPEGAVPPAPAAPSPDERARKVVRRLAVCRVALWLDTWKGAPPAELLAPLEKAEASFASGDLGTAETSLDLLSVRFAEPRWTSMPLPFRNLRVNIPAPQPPAWDPENALPADQREALRAHRATETLLSILSASVAWADAHGISCADVLAPLELARSAFAAGTNDASVFGPMDAAADALRVRVRMPARGAPAHAAPVTPAIREA
ncbi:MAG: hypothetical protein L3K09_01140 [Thermoplasmata archaeon]|nr:hypothetical protein [Thermoplasmata archaeon]